MKTSLQFTASLILISISLFSCSSQNSEIGNIANKYLKDSIIPRMNDPKSFELISMKYDSTYDHAYYSKELEIDSKELKTSESIDHSTVSLDTNSNETDILAQYRKSKDELRNEYNIKRVKELYDSIAAYKSTLNKPDSLRTVIVTVEFRGKNAFGGLVINTVKLEYNRPANSIVNAW
jgi:hypothetical protein